MYSRDKKNSSPFFMILSQDFGAKSQYLMLWADQAWSLVSNVPLDGKISQYLAVLSKKTSKCYEKGRRVLLTATVKGVWSATLMGTVM